MLLVLYKIWKKSVVRRIESSTFYLVDAHTFFAHVLFFCYGIALAILSDFPFSLEKLVNPFDCYSPLSVSFLVFFSVRVVNQAEALELCDVTVPGGVES